MYVDIVKLLLVNKADSYIKDDEGSTVYDSCPTSIRDIIGEFDKKKHWMRGKCQERLWEEASDNVAFVKLGLERSFHIFHKM